MAAPTGIQREDYPIVGSYNNQRSQAISPERSINVFEYKDPKAKHPQVLINTSGLVAQDLTFSGASATDEARLDFVFGGFTYRLIGSRLYQIQVIADELAVFLIGTINTSSGFVGFDANNSQIIMVDGTDGWIYDTVDGLRIITDPGFPASPLDATFLDGFFSVAAGGTKNFQLSSLNQGLVWSEGSGTFSVADTTSIVTLTFTTPGSGGTTAYFQVGTPVIVTGSSNTTALPNSTYYVKEVLGTSTISISATQGGAAYTNTTGVAVIGNFTNNGALQIGSILSHPGNIVACRTLHRRLFLFSDNFTEVWENQGLGTNLPFRRNNSLLIEYGTPSAASIATGFDYMLFLSQDSGGLGSVQQVSGSRVEPVSTSALDYQLSQYAAAQQVSDATGMLLKENGLIFYRLNFTAADNTFVYNVTQSTPVDRLWHEEEMLNESRHIAQTHAYFNGNNYVGAYNSPTWYKISPDVYLNGTEKIRRLRIGKPVTPPAGYRIKVHRFELDMLQGSATNLIPATEDVYILTEAEELIETEDGLFDLMTETQITYDLQETPYVFLATSKDSGQTYGNELKTRMGKVGERTYRTVWRKLGAFPRNQAFVPKLEFYNDAAFIILGASFVYEILPE